jgi:hypothetical protein
VRSGTQCAIQTIASLRLLLANLQTLDDNKSTPLGSSIEMGGPLLQVLLVPCGF